MGTLGNFTLSKKSEILEKSSVNESLLSSPLSDKIFGLSVQNQEIFQYCYKKSLEVKPNYPESLEELWKHA
jgi:hypothetical protein